MPDGSKLKKAKLRGVASEGMILAASELEMGAGDEGILVLDDHTLDGALIGLRSDDSARYGNLQCDGQSNLLSFNEKTPGGGLISAGVYLLRRALLDSFPQKRPLSFETDLFPALLQAGKKIRVHEVRAAFIDIGTEQTFREAESFFAANRGWCS